MGHTLRHVAIAEKFHNLEIGDWFRLYLDWNDDDFFALKPAVYLKMSAQTAIRLMPDEEGFETINIHPDHPIVRAIVNFEVKTMGVY